MSEDKSVMDIIQQKLKRSKMTVRAEVHVIQTLVAGRLNRDDTNSLKRLNVGGTERAVISSQAQKRPLREALGPTFSELDLGEGAVITRQIPTVISEALAEKLSVDLDAVKKVVNDVWENTKAKSKTNDRNGEALTKDAPTMYSTEEISRIAELIETNYTQLTQKNNKETMNEVSNEIRRMFTEGKHVDITTHLFGRMMASIPQGTVDGCVYTSFGVGTHPNNVMNEAFTTQDDFGENTGAAMIGYREVNSTTYYRYSHVDVHELHERISEQNGSNPQLTAEVTAKYLEHFTQVTPTGGQHSNAATDAPYFILVVVRTNSNAHTLAAAVDSAVKHADDVAYASVIKLHQGWKHALRQQTNGTIKAYALEYEHDDKPKVFTHETTQVETLTTLLDKVKSDITEALNH